MRITLAKLIDEYIPDDVPFGEIEISIHTFDADTCSDLDPVYEIDTKTLVLRESLG
jgi:hypothetical protein